MQSIRRIVALALLTLLGASTAEAQSLTFGELGGMVMDASRAPVTDADVSVRDRNSGASRRMSTGRDGVYRFAALPAGRYDVTVEALGFRPVTHLDVAVSAGHAATLEVTLRPAVLPVTSIDTVRVGSLSAHPGAWLLERGYADLMGERRTASDLAFLSTTSDGRSIEGLPWRFTGAMVDGARSKSVASPVGGGSESALLAFPSRSASFAQVGGLGFDVEVGGTGLGARLATRRAGSDAASSSLVEGGTAMIGGAFSASGPLQGDTAQAGFGVEYQRSEISRPALLGADGTFAAALASASQGTYATDVSAYGVPAERVTDRLGAFGRLDWQPGERLAVSVRASGSRLTSRGLREPLGIARGYDSDFEAFSAQAALNVYGRLTRRIAHEFRLSADVGSLDSGDDALPLTEFAGAGLSIGGPTGFDESRTTPRASGMFHFHLGDHQLKAGVEFASHLFDSRYVAGSRGAYRFGDVVDFTAGDGAWRGVEGASPAGEFRLSERAIFLQDAWRVADGFAITLGARFDGATLPVGELDGNADWFAATGVDNRDVERKRSAFSPRLGVRWELGRRREWLIEGGMGLFQHLPDQRDVAEALTFDRGAMVREGVGGLGAWPNVPAAVAAPEIGRTISLLGPEFEGPRTRRLGLSLSRRLGSWISSVSGVYRHTDFLSRRRDLNLTTGVLGADQYGRPLHGTLRQVGTLLVSEPGSNRRFSAFDAAHVIESTGYSDFWAVSVGTERVREEGLSLAASYTYSRTTDNVSLLGGSRLAPFQDGLAGVDWAEGRSDLDVPHRLMFAAEWSSGADRALRIGALYRLSSGLPFTPGLRGGVDANGDGDGSNDPAFIDPALPGIAGLAADWGCLGSVPGFAERNSCRAELAHRLDLRVAFRITELRLGRLDLVLDALDVVATEHGRIDSALLLLDRNGTITTNPISGVTSVPYVANPAFGRVLADRSPGILWRAGLRVTP